MLIVPTRLMKNSHIPSPQAVGYHILGFLILKGWQVDLHLETLLACANLWLQWDVLIIVECRELWLLPQSEVSTPEEGEPLEKHLGFPGVPCCLHCLPPLPACQTWSVLTSFWTFPHPSLTSSCQHYRQQLRAGWLSSTLSGVPRPSGLPFLLHDGICNSSAAFLHIVYCCFYLCSCPGPIDWTHQAEFNFLCISIERPSLCMHFPKNRIASPSVRTTASVMQSLGHASCNISVISDPLHAWEGGGWSPIFSPRVILT